MIVNNKPGTKDRLFEMMEKVNKVKLNENIYSDAQKEQSMPYGGNGQTMQTGINYADNKPTNSNVRVNAPELEKVVENDEVIRDIEKALEPVNDFGKLRKDEILSYTLDTLKKRAGDPNYKPTKDEFMKELIKTVPKHKLAFMNEKEEVEEPTEEPETTEKEPETNDGMSLEPKGDEIAQLAQDKEESGEVLVGGKGDGKSPLEFDPEQVLKGLEVEKEHTDDNLIAIEIVLDHLTEDPEYYTRKDDPEASAQDGAASDAGENIDELNTSTYANVMNKTSNYPWKNDDKTRNKMGNINKLTKERFEQEFYNEFPKESTKIVTNLGEYTFVGIKYDTNYNKYWLIFVKKHGLGMDDYLWIKDDNGQIYIDNNINKGVEIDNNSKNLINQMLKYDVNRLQEDIVDDKETTDELLGYKPINVGEEFDYAAAEREYEDTEEYKKFLQYQAMDWDTLNDQQKEEYFELWKTYHKGV